MDSWKPYLILGIGNCLMSDDGAGVHAARILQAEPPPETAVLATETDFLCAISFLERCAKALVIDAMDAGQPPGTLFYCRGEDLAETGQRHSLHGLGLLGALEFLDRKHRPEVHILGVHPGWTGFALQLSAEVASVLPQVVRVARRIIVEFGRLDPTDSMSGGKKVAHRIFSDVTHYKINPYISPDFKHRAACLRSVSNLRGSQPPFSLDSHPQNYNRLSVMRKVWIYKRKSIKGWWVGWY